MSELCRIISDTYSYIRTSAKAGANFVYRANDEQKNYMKKKLFFLVLLALIPFSVSLFAQENFILSHDDSLALENVIVEKYYIAKSSDCKDTTGGVLQKGSVTYRIFIDMKPGYKLQMVYGDQNHELLLKTSTTFFNNQYILAVTGYGIPYKEINNNTVALDSWISMGAASRLHTGIPIADDKDGSILTRKALLKADGLTNGVFPTFKPFNIDLNFFKDIKDASYFTTNNGAWAALEGVKGPNEDNKVLIAQLTTSGTLSIKLNVQIGTPTKGFVKFVATKPVKNEVQFKGLAF